MHLHLAYSHLHTHLRMSVHYRCVIYLLGRYNGCLIICSNLESYHRYHQTFCQTYKGCSIIIPIQCWVEYRCAEVFILLPTEGGRDLLVDDWTQWAPTDSWWIHLELRRGPNILDICRGMRMQMFTIPWLLHLWLWFIQGCSWVTPTKF